MKNTKYILLFLMTLIIISSCDIFSPSSLSDNYFPLKVGNYWSYKITYLDNFGNPIDTTTTFRIIRQERINGKKYYTFDNIPPFFPLETLADVEGLDTIKIRNLNNEKLLMLINGIEYEHLTFSDIIVDSTARLNIEGAEFIIDYISKNDTINIDIGSFNSCIEICTYYPRIRGPIFYTWFTPGIGAVKIYNPGYYVTYELSDYNIEN